MHIAKTLVFIKVFIKTLRFYKGFSEGFCNNHMVFIKVVVKSIWLSQGFLWNLRVFTKVFKKNLGLLQFFTKPSPLTEYMQIPNGFTRV